MGAKQGGQEGGKEGESEAPSSSFEGHKKDKQLGS